MDATAIPATTSPARKAVNPLILVPGILFWGLIGTGLATDQHAFFGAGIAVFAVSAIFMLVRAIRRSNQRRAENRRVWHEGADARATVVGLSTNGGSLNDHPYIDLELDVAAPGGPARRVSVRALISLLAIPRVQPRCEIAVKVDRHNDNLVVIDPALTPYGY